MGGDEGEGGHKHYITPTLALPRQGGGEDGSKGDVLFFKGAFRRPLFLFAFQSDFDMLFLKAIWRASAYNT